MRSLLNQNLRCFNGLQNNEKKTEEKIFSQGDARISNAFSYQCNQED